MLSMQIELTVDMVLLKLKMQISVREEQILRAVTTSLARDGVPIEAVDTAPLTLG